MKKINPEQQASTLLDFNTTNNLLILTGANKGVKSPTKNINQFLPKMSSQQSTTLPGEDILNFKKRTLNEAYETFPDKKFEINAMKR